MAPISFSLTKVTKVITDWIIWQCISLILIIASVFGRSLSIQMTPLQNGLTVSRFPHPALLVALVQTNQTHGRAPIKALFRLSCLDAPRKLRDWISLMPQINLLTEYYCPRVLSCTQIAESTTSTYQLSLVGCVRQKVVFVGGSRGAG